VALGEYERQRGSNTNTVNPPTETSPAQRGNILKEVRESKGISLETVHEHTKIPLDALRAIEEGYTIRMLSTFYQRGFTKNYAKYLGVDVKDVVSDVKEVKLPPAPPTPPLFKKKGKEVEQKKDNVDFKKKLEDFFTSQRKQQLAVGLGLFLALFLVVKILGWMIHKIQTRPVAQKNVIIKEKPSQAMGMQVKTPPKSETLKASIVSTSSGALLTVRAKKSSWVRVKTDGKVVFESQLRVGSVETWKAKDKIEVAGKNLNELEFEVNGKMIGQLTRKDREAKALVVTKDGLTVTK